MMGDGSMKTPQVLGAIEAMLEAMGKLKVAINRFEESDDVVNLVSLKEEKDERIKELEEKIDEIKDEVEGAQSDAEDVGNRLENIDFDY